jgi:predicted regulator of Ras-like GTPase activity (Roadblock/LC7/MglB family)
VAEEDGLLAEIQALRDRVTGLTGAAVASRDGLIIRADVDDVSPDNLAALAAAWLGVAQRMASEAGHGLLREAVTRSSGGYVAIYAVGRTAVLLLTGDEGLDVGRLHRESRTSVENIEALLASAGAAPGVSGPRGGLTPPASRRCGPAGRSGRRPGITGPAGRLSPV